MMAGEVPNVSRIVNATGCTIPADVLVDLCSRFVINIPEEERQDLIRIFFQIELAHWFYLDFYCQEREDLKPCGIKEFSTQVFKSCPTLIPHSDNVDSILESWREYKMMVPTYGAILLNSSCTHVLEETGFDIAELIDLNEYIDFKMHEQLTRLYIISNVPMNTVFQPRTRNEIKRLEWFNISQLPLHKKDTVCKQELGLNPNAFFMVIPFVRHLRKWISLNQAPKKNKDNNNCSEDSEDTQNLPRDNRAKLFSKKKRDDQTPYLRRKSFTQGRNSKEKQIKILQQDSVGNQSIDFCVSNERSRGLKGRGAKKGVSAWNNFHLNADDILNAMQWCQTSHAENSTDLK